ncbi:MAG: UvrD-helicase domain-containing protein [Bacteroidetes bacterium]|nr:UvrD-helicase domain-containing protein [Bacteroidota bacterium]
MEELFKDLNDAQQEAVRNFNGPSLVIAGAGSGKTRVLTYRIAYLLQCGVRADSVLALTFTNKAAREMKERIVSLVGVEKAGNLWMGTFHSIFARILRYESQSLGYQSNYAIYDTIDSKSLIKSIIKELKLDEDIYKPGEIQSRISHAKNDLITPDAYLANRQFAERDRNSKKPETGRIYKIYAQRCYKSGAMDFDDLLLNTNILFRDFPAILEKYRKWFRYILVDEYQDTNISQYLILNKLAENHHNICVVGDDAQSIYSFRGARIENILNFKNDYPDYKLYKLEQNYRSTRIIVEAANSVIQKNRDQIQKKLFSENETGCRIRVIKSLTDREEGYVISNMILDSHLSDHDDYSEFAILYRTNAQSRIFEESLRKRNIPYKIYGGLSFYQRKEIKDLLAYFRLVVNPNDDESLKRIINYPARGIGKTTVEKLEAIVAKADTSVWEVLINAGKFSGVFNQGTIQKLKAFVEMIIEFSSGLNNQDAYDLAFSIASATGLLKELYNDKSPESVSRYENIQELLNGIREFTVYENNPEDRIITLDRYIQNVSLLTNEDNEKEEDRNKVTLMTVHSAKGLEFNNVYIVGVEQDLFPSSFSAASQQDIEEERRLFYVAVTRTKKRAVLSYAMSRYRWGTPVECKPSRFLREIDPQYLDRQDSDPADGNELLVSGSRSETGRFRRKPFVKKEREIAENTFIPKNLVRLKTVKASGLENENHNADSAGKIRIGMKVEHQRFGIGKVIQIEGSPQDIKATVFFQTAGQKQLLLKFARLKIVE